MIHYYVCRETEGGEAILAMADNPSFFAESSNQFEPGWYSSIPGILVEPDGDTTGTVFVEEITEAEYKNIESFNLTRIASIGEYQLRRIHRSAGAGAGGNVQMQAGQGGSSGVGGAVMITPGAGAAGGL